MKILHVITLSELGGAQSVILNLAKQSIEDGHEVMVASSANGELWNELPEGVKKITINSLQRAISPVKDFQAVVQLMRVNSMFKPDVVHLHSSKIGILGRLAFPAKKIIYTVHGFDSIRIAFRKFLYFEKLLQFRAKHIVAVSKYDYNNLIGEGISRNVSYIYNGIADFNTASDKINTNNSEIKDILAQSDTFNVLCIARMAPPKRFDLFCETANHLKEHGIRFFWVGNKQPVSGLPENVLCLGEVTNAHQLLPYTQAFILLSDYEGMPMSILEALCYGVPVIASDVGGIGEVLNTKNGFALKNESTLLARHILDYKNDATLYQAAKIHARDSYMAEFTIHKMYKSYLKLYNDVINKSDPQAIKSL
jgi:glycosyltransferase involved in cell wall biosynthesis